MQTLFTNQDPLNTINEAHDIEWLKEFYGKHCPARQAAQCNNRSMPCKYLIEERCSHKEFPIADRKPLGMR